MGSGACGGSSAVCCTRARYAAIADSATLFDTNGATPTVIARSRHGEMTVLNQDAYDAFHAKAAINPAASGPSDLYSRPED